MRSVTIMFLPFFIVDPCSLDYKKKINSYVPLKICPQNLQKPKIQDGRQRWFFLYTAKDNSETICSKIIDEESFSTNSEVLNLMR